MNDLATLIEAKRCDEAWQQLLALTRRATHYAEVVPLCRARQRLLALQPGPATGQKVRVALLGYATTGFFEEPLALELAASGLQCTLYVAAFNTATWEMLTPASPVGAFAPDVAVVVNTPASVSHWPGPADTLAQVRAAADEVCDTWLTLCARLHERTHCEVVLDNLHLLPTRPLGNLGAKLPYDANAFIRRVNGLLGERSPSFVHISDVDTLASHCGVRRWFDARYWYEARQPVSMDCLLLYVRNLARIIAAIFGRTAKCLVLDLDNTLWGGVVGDDGVDALRIGPGTAVGEAHLEFQRYVLSLRQRGVLLAACSRNDEQVALRPFVERPEMLLRRDDFVAFKANWRPKPDNLLEIATELNIGLDTMVFADDNPAECEHVRLQLPEVRVVALTADPADYPCLIDDTGAFEVTAITREDRERTAQYQTDADRRITRQLVGDYGTYLSALEQTAVIGPFEEPHLDRIAQLINKTNQFNLTSERMSASAVASAMRDPQMFTACVRLADRFGDNGLISVLMARLLSRAAVIEQWLMSCRVLNREVEVLLLNYTVSWMRRLDIELLRGVYKPTSRNGLVRQHYGSLGFALEREEPDGVTRWTLAVDSFVPRPVHFTSVEGYEREP